MARLDNNNVLNSQATVFGSYLVNTSVVSSARTSYIEAMLENPGSPDRKDQRLLELITAHPYTVAFVDAGLAVLKPQSEIRRRLYIMFAILEARPEYADSFLPKHRAPYYLVFVIMRSIGATIKSLLGILIIKAVR